MDQTNQTNKTQQGQGFNKSSGAEYAGFWIRLLAAIIDGFILGIAGSIVLFVFGGVLILTPPL